MRRIPIIFIYLLRVLDDDGGRSPGIVSILKTFVNIILFYSVYCRYFVLISLFLSPLIFILPLRLNTRVSDQFFCFYSFIISVTRIAASFTFPSVFENNNHFVPCIGEKKYV